MKEELSEESRLSLVNYRIDRANEMGNVSLVSYDYMCK